MSDLSAIQEKVSKGEALSADETRAIMSSTDNMSVVPDGEDEVDWDKTIDGEKKKEEEAKPQENAGKKEDKAREKTPADLRREEKEKEYAERKRIQDELDKPHEERDIVKNASNYDARTKAYFHEMQAERKARQKAEAELDSLKFSIAKQKGVPAQQAPVQPDPILDGDDDEFISRGEMKKILQQSQAAANKKDDPTSDFPQQQIMTNNYIKICEEVTKNKYEDFQDVMDCYGTVIGNLDEPGNPYTKKIQNAMNSGENVIEMVYKTIKSDPDFEDAIEKIRAKKAPAQPAVKPDNQEKLRLEAEEKERRVRENKNKARTSGSFNGGGDADDGMSMNDILNMSDAAFARLPKDKRSKILKQFG